MFVGMGANSGGGYNLESSLRFRSSATAYLSRTPATASNQKTYTYSTWVKRGILGSLQMLLHAATSSAQDYTILWFQSTDELKFFTNVGNLDRANLITTMKFRDPSAWYHIVLATDTTQATASNRVKMYVNGEQITAFSSSTYPNLNEEAKINSTEVHRIGVNVNTNFQPLDGYMTEVNFVDGQALTPSDFGEYDDTTGVWKPKEYTGTYGTNGFYLNFSDSTSTTTLGYDQSSNSNNWTLNNISLTAGATYDLMNDVPTLTDEDTANFATLNAVDLSNSSYAPTNANLTYYIAGGNANNQRGSIAVNSGKWYWECTMQTGGGNALIGVARADLRNDTTINFNSANGWYYYGLTGNKYNSGNQGSYGSTYTTGDVIGFALDMDSGKIWWSKNGTWQASGDPAAGTNAAFTNVSGLVTSNVNNGYGGTLTGDYNYGQRPFAYTPPTGFKKLNTYNLPDSTIVDGSQYFDTVLWTGDNSSSRTISTNFTPNFIWLKPRNVAESHGLFDTVRGDGLRLVTNGTGAEGNITWAKFVSNGFQVDGTTYNNSGYNFVGWHWKGSDSSAVSNTDGTITSTVSANPTSGFSIATGTMPASGGFTVGHGLGVAPDMYIFKRTTNASAWGIWHKGLSGGTYYLAFTTAAQVNDSTVFSASPTNQVLNIGSAWASGGQNFVAYCFADVEGFSKFGSYTGNGSTDGPFVYTGFRPAFVMYKRTDIAANWRMNDTARDTNNDGSSYDLFANSSQAEASSARLDILSNGFKCITTSADTNGSGGTYIYMAFAETPFKQSLAR